LTANKKWKHGLDLDNIFLEMGFGENWLNGIFNPSHLSPSLFRTLPLKVLS